MTFIGSPGPVETNREIVWDKTNGWATEITWEGNHEAVKGKANEIVTVAMDLRIDISRPIGRLVGRFASVQPDGGVADNDTELFTDTWELLGNDIERDLYEHPKALALDQATLLFVKTAIRQFESDNTSTAVFADANAKILYELKIRGTDSFIVSQFVLRQTRVATNKYTAQVAFSNLEKIHSVAQLPSLPAGLLFSISQIPAPSSVPPAYFWGWLKKTPSVEVIAGGRIRISQEWWLEIWSTFIYGLAV